MEKKILNRPEIERVAREVMQLDQPEQIEAFVNMFVYTMLLD
ncbi:MAG: hypothetical protein ACOWWR_12545 [Eubacteriales bacterium]